LPDIRSIGAPVESVRIRMDGAILSARANKVAAATAERIAKDFAQTAREHIQNQDLPWEPLSVDYLMWKQDVGLNENIWIAGGILIDQIEVRPGREIRLKDGSTVRVGWMAGIFDDAEHPLDPLDHSKGMIPTWIIAESLEFGMPRTGQEPRPIFRTALRETFTRVRRGKKRKPPEVPARPLFRPSLDEVIAKERGTPPPPSRGQ